MHHFSRKLYHTPHHDLPKKEGEVSNFIKNSRKLQYVNNLAKTKVWQWQSLWQCFVVNNYVNFEEQEDKKGIKIQEVDRVFKVASSHQMNETTSPWNITMVF